MPKEGCALMPKGVCALMPKRVGCTCRRAAVRDLRNCLLAWHSACEHRAWRLAMLELGVQRRYNVICGAVLTAWSAEVVRARLRRRGMARLQQRRELGMLQAHLRTWQQVVADNRCAGGGKQGQGLAWWCTGQDEKWAHESPTIWRLSCLCVAAQPC
eukprot:1156772-Pelagomonas_calceolata.AAC.2